MPELHPIIAKVTQRIQIRSKNTRSAYLDAIDEMAIQREHLYGMLARIVLFIVLIFD